MLREGIVPGVPYVPGGNNKHVQALVGNQAGKRPAAAVAAEAAGEEGAAPDGMQRQGFAKKVTVTFSGEFVDVTEFVREIEPREEPQTESD